jgi:DNA mismatch endonuclease (patch repair protein)
MIKPSEARSRIMRAVKSCDTRPELALRSLAHRMGYRFRLHRKDLPGKPDMVFPAKRKAIFMHGCFWHCHDCGRGARIPVQNRDYWDAKLTRNRERDESSMKALAALGWEAIVFWECELQVPKQVAKKLRSFLR